MSSLTGPRIAGKRRCSTAMTSLVSSTESVVWVTKASFAGSFTCRASASSTVSISVDGAVRQLAGGADHFRMALVADEDDGKALVVVAPGLHVNLGDQRAGGIDLEHVARRGGSRNRLRHAMGGKDHGPVAIGDFVELLDEDSALGLEVVDHEPVVHDLVAHIDRARRRVPRPARRCRWHAPRRRRSRAARPAGW